MRKFVVTLMASLLSSSAAFAFWPEATDSLLEVGVGYRQDKLEWKTASHFDSGSYSDGGYFDGGYSDGCECGLPLKLRSELKWRDLRIWQIDARGKYVTCDNIYFRASGDYGWITSGKNTDSDFVTFDGSGDLSDGVSGNALEFAHSKSKTKGHVYDGKIAIGYQFKLCDDTFAMAPLVGYSWHGQHIEDHHLRQNFYLDDEFLFPGEEIGGARSYSGYYPSFDYDSYSDFSYDSSSNGANHSKYHARWNGPFVGFDFDYRFGSGCETNWELFGDYEFHWAVYRAKAHWNLRPDLFDGFHHRAKKAYGHVFDIGIKYDFCECWTLALRGEFQWWWADHGRDRAKIAEIGCGNVRTDCQLTIPLRDIKWQSASVSLDLGMVF